MHRFPVPGFGCAVVVMNDRCFSILASIGRTEDAPEHAGNRRAVYSDSSRDWPSDSVTVGVEKGANEFHRPTIGQGLEDQVTLELSELVGLARVTRENESGADDEHAQ